MLRGGSDAIQSNTAIVAALKEGLREAGLNPDAVQLVEDTSRETAAEMMRLREFIDVLIPISAPKPNSSPSVKRVEALT